MINLEVEELEKITKELEKGVINMEDIEQRLQEEENEVDRLSIEELRVSQKTTNFAQWF